MVGLLVVSCNSNAIYDQFQPIENHKWSSNNKIEFIVNNVDTISKKNVFINIRNNSTYEFSNLYLITELVYPNKTIVTDTLHYQMANELGAFLGVGFTEIKENKLFYKEKKIFPIKGTYSFTVRHAMRKNGVVSPIDFLKGIQDVGFSIENLD